MQSTCPHCGSTSVIHIQTITQRKLSYYRCSSCFKSFSLPDPPEYKGEECSQELSNSSSITADSSTDPSSFTAEIQSSELSDKNRSSFNNEPAQTEDGSGTCPVPASAQAHKCAETSLTEQPAQTTSFSSADTQVKTQDSLDELKTKTLPCSKEKAALSQVKDLMRLNLFGKAKIILNQLPSNEQTALQMLFFKTIVSFGKDGYISATYCYLNSALSILDDHLSCMDSLLPQNDTTRRYEILSSIFDAIIIFAKLPIKFYSSSSYKKYDKYGEVNVVSHVRTYAWLQRTVIIGKLAQYLESLHTDSLYGDEYRRMTASLWSACLNYKQKDRVHLSFSDDLSTIILDKLLNHITVTKYEKKLRRQIKNKLKKPSASVELVYPHIDRDKAELRIKITAFCSLLIIGLSAVWLANRR